MQPKFTNPLKWLSGLTALTSLCALSLVPAHAQNDDFGGFSVNEDENTALERPEPRNNNASAKSSEAPIRLARICYVEGNVRWRTSADNDWSFASNNLPVRQGAQIWIERKGRAELQFDDGSMLRLGSNALVTLQLLYSDSEGTFTEIKLQEGLASLRLRHKLAVYQIDTPFASVKAKGPTKVRVGAGRSVEFAVREGEATVEGGQGSVTLKRGDYLRLASSMSEYEVLSIPGRDSWDSWNTDRDRLMEEGVSKQYVPANVSYMSYELDQSGDWRDDSTYGHVWCPRVASNWRPYSDGQWVWVEPFGWTWVGNESWGWTPYHYGTWIRRPFGWVWVPGARYQAWCPAPVHFCSYGESVVWVPIAPSEIVYTEPSPYCRRMHDYFSITLAVNYESGREHCYARPYNTTYVNQNTYVTNYVTNNYITNNYGSDVRTSPRAGLYASDRLNYRPYNMREGAVMTGQRDFGVRTVHSIVSAQSLESNQLRTIGMLRGSQNIVNGPAHILPTRTAVTSAKTVETTLQPRMGVAERPVFRAALPTSVERNLPAATRERLQADNRTSANSGTTTTRPTERTSQRETSSAREGSDSTADIIRHARASVGLPSAPKREETRTETPRKEEPVKKTEVPAPAPRREEPVRRESPAPAPRREEPVRRESPAPAPRREEPAPRKETPAPAPAPRREEPAPRRESPAPAPAPAPPRYDPPRRNIPLPSPPPQRREEPAPRRESPAPAPRQDPAPRRERDRERGRG